MITAGSLLAVLAGHLHLSHPQQVWCGEGEQAAPRGPLWRGGSQQHPLCSELSTPGAFHSCLSLDPHPPRMQDKQKPPVRRRKRSQGWGWGVKEELAQGCWVASHSLALPWRPPDGRVPPDSSNRKLRPHLPSWSALGAHIGGGSTWRQQQGS